MRYDGGHKRHDFVMDSLRPFVTFVPVCPELEIGLGVPREPIHLVREAGALRLVGRTSGRDHTAAMTRYAGRRVRALVGDGLHGYILKRDSPSCGMERVKVRAAGGGVEKNGRGLFAEALLRAMPHLPVEEEGRLEDPRLRENFLERVFACRRLRTLFSRRWTAGDLVRAHTAEKMLLLAHDRAAYEELGRLVAAPRGTSREGLRERYEAIFMAGLRRIATPARHANVLQHMAGHLHDHLDPGERAELAGLVDDYRRGIVSRIAPVTLVRHHVMKHHITYLAGQTYLEPHPRELMG